MSTDDWLRRYHPAPSGAPRLVCFAHAGGSANFWYPLSAALRDRVDVTAVQYPGRQDRYAEPPLTDLHELADRIAGALLPGWPGAEPPALLGHSMGALLAYETGLRLAAATGRGPRLLVASGRRAPSAVRTERGLHDASDEDLLAELSDLGGTVPAVLADPELRELFLPPLRADYRAVETYRHRPGVRLDCPVTVLTGAADHKVTAAEAAAWSEHTAGPVEVRTWPGGHFFLTDHQEALTALLADRLTAGVA
ncbi:thioesterase II family protein [Streptomyces sp. TLI_171]|uniref:thioesterase II family protein n=1 Tax=Streptomyces sp. TLI_171 TaxID=1938859 RepID=UPI000C198AD2|nr:alpha/beta fold hydrolase [Streptomyces sp. TLI_171]RKE22704.1 surfactin synthase thioesterase subunit [Streptomyces sp. TLI_171]